MSSVRADMTRNVILLLLVFLCRTSMSYKILSVMPIPGVSHTKIPTHIMHGLAAKGHQVTVLSHFHSGENITNYKSIIFDKPSKLMVNNRDMTNFDASSIFDKFTGTTFRLLDIEKIVCQQMQTKAFQRLLNSNETYDVVLVELFNSDCMSVLADKFKAPIVGISASCPFPWVANRIGLPLDTSYSPSLLIGLSNKMTFPQRVLNTVAEIWYIFFYKYYIEPSDYHFVKQSYKDIRPTNILTERLSVLLANCHFTLAYPRTSVPGLIDIAGLVPERTAIPTMTTSFSCMSILRRMRSLKILGVFPHPGKSHVDVFLPIMRGLAEKGHNVTVLSYFPSDEPIMRYNDVSLKDSIDGMEINLEDFYPGSRLKRYLTPLNLKHLAATTCEGGMTAEEFKPFFRSSERYDIMLIELFNTDCFIGLAEKFQAEVIGLSSCTLMSWYHDRFGNPSHTAYIPNNLLTLSVKMGFWERFENTVITLLHQTYYNQITHRNDKRIAKELLGSKASDLNKVIKKIRLVLVNSHFSLNLPKPLVPNVIEIGGVHVKEPNQLPKNLEKWISESKHGVIYFSMGSLLRGHTLPKQKRDAFLKAFARLPQRVLWKWENDTMEDQPTNVMIQKWMPQFDILSHPNVKAFISHGGLLGTIEAVHCGVPIVVMPQFGDQHTNAKAIEANGGGVILSLNDVTEDSVYSALTTVLTPAFRRKAKQLSERFRDRPMPPLETAIYWIEYVARHKGAPHLRSAAVDMPFYQYYLLDVFGLLLLIFSVFIYLIYFMCKTVISLFRKTKVIEKEKSS